MKTHCLCRASTLELIEALSPRHLGNPRSRLRDRPKHRMGRILFGYLLIALLPEVV